MMIVIKLKMLKLFLMLMIQIVLIKSNEFIESELLSSPSQETKNISIQESNKRFWDTIYQNSKFNTKSAYNMMSGDNVCFTCPINADTYKSLYENAQRASNLDDTEIPPRVTIAWRSQMPDNRVIFFCRNNTRVVSSPVYLSSENEFEQNLGADSGGQLEYSCEDNKLCLANLKYNYPKKYQCMVKSYVLDVNLNVIVHLQYVIMYFSGDSVKFDYQKEVQVYENQVFTVKCEVPETNPVSQVNAYIDNKELKLTRLDKKTLDNRMTINTYSFEINATRNMNGKKVKCEAQMKDLPAEFANSHGFRSHISKDYTLSVYYLPVCVHSERTYRTGMNRSIVIECPINASNPDVTHYKIIAPSTKTKVDYLESDLETLHRVGRFRMNPSSLADFGLYECIPRSLAGTAKCDIIVELGATPNPPEQCTVQLALVNNKTYAQFSCKPGFNQGGLTSFLTIYEVNPIDKQLKLSGRVNIDESKTDKEVPYITPADEDKYYEFLIMQENNYGNSTAITLTLGTSAEAKEIQFWSSNNLLLVGCGTGVLLFVFFVCICCCITDGFSSSKSDNPCCRCCAPSDSMDGDMSTYKKAPLDSDLIDVIGGSSFQPMQGFSQDTKNFQSSTYEYYDNASAGLLAESGNNHTYVRTNTYQHQKIYNQQYDEEEEIEEEEDDDHYMNNAEERNTLKRPLNKKNSSASNHYDTNNYEDDSSETSSGRKSSHDDQQVFIVEKNTAKHKNLYDDQFNRNKLNSKVGSASYNLNSNNYSTIDSKNLKLIKTENGLVYTPLNANTIKKLNKSNDALETKEDHDIKYREENGYDGLDEKRAKPIISSTYSNVKKITVNTNSISKMPLDFQNELNSRLKSITTNKEQQETTLKVNANGKFQSEPMSNSTATTSLSSASSCTSNSDLTLKKDNFQSNNTNGKRLAPLVTNSDIESEAATPNPNYSLLKTTLNGVSETNGTKSQAKINGVNYNSYKPPILKPKPRTNNIYQMNGNCNGAVPVKKHLNTTFESIHNQSTDPLLNQTSPSTSITDVSSNNCTPQHYNSNLNEDISAAQLNSLVKNNSYRTATIGRPVHQNGTNSTTTSNNTLKATTTFTTNPIGDGTQLIYSTTKINGMNINDHLVTTSYMNNGHANGANTLKTFSNSNGSVYETSTLNRKPTVKKLDELNKFPDVAVNGSASSSAMRTLERRHVKNSEC